MSNLRVRFEETISTDNIKISICPVDHPQSRSWLRHCATNRKVAGSIPDGVIGIFH
jgi:hypothetical protein